MKLFIILINLSFLLSYETFINENLFDDFPDPYNYVANSLIEILNTIIEKKVDVSDQCRTNLLFTLNPENSHYIKKLITNSITDKNDLTAYSTCLAIDEYPQINNSYDEEAFLSNLTYSVFQINKKFTIGIADIRFINEQYVLGLCMIKGCSNLDLIELFYAVNKEMGNPFKFNSTKDIDVFIMNNKSSYSIFEYLINLIPFYLIMLQIFFTIYPRIPQFIISYFFKIKNKLMNKSTNKNVKEDIMANKESKDRHTINDRTEVDKDIDHINRNSISFTPHDLKICFSLTDNLEIFLVESSNVENDSGLRNLRGLVGIFMILMTIGHIYYNLINSPLKVYSELQYRSFITSAFFGIIMTGMRYSSRFLISYSGYSLIYKMFCYLDEIVENSESDEYSLDESLQRNSIDDQIESSLFEEEFSFRKTRRFYPELKLFHLFEFIKSQSYKYLIFVLFVCHYKFSFYSLLFRDSRPIWTYMKKNLIDRFSTIDLIGTLFLFNPYYNSHETINNFWIPIVEITCFLFTVPIIFFSYKYNFRMDLLFIGTFFGVIIFKIVYFLTSPNLFSCLDNNIDGSTQFYSSPLYNYTFYLIGVGYGMINYIIQKSIEEENIIEKGKTYLNYSLYLVRFYKINKVTKVLITTMIGTLILLFLFVSYPILLTLLGDVSNDVHLENFNKLIFVNLFYLLDKEFFIFALYFVFISLYSLGDNFFLDFFSHFNWTWLSRCYFSFIVICNQIINFILYGSESRTKLEIFNILFLSLSITTCTVFCSIIVHVTFEMPCKNIIKKFRKSPQ